MLTPKTSDSEKPRHRARLMDGFDVWLETLLKVHCGLVILNVLHIHVTKSLTHMMQVWQPIIFILASGVNHALGLN